MKYFLIVAFLSLFISCNSQDKRPLIGETEYQQKLNAVFKDASKSPLKKQRFKKLQRLGLLSCRLVLHHNSFN